MIDIAGIVFCIWAVLAHLAALDRIADALEGKSRSAPVAVPDEPEPPRDYSGICARIRPWKDGASVSLMRDGDTLATVHTTSRIVILQRPQGMTALTFGEDQLLVEKVIDERKD